MCHILFFILMILYFVWYLMFPTQCEYNFWIITMYISCMFQICCSASYWKHEVDDYACCDHVNPVVFSVSPIDVTDRQDVNVKSKWKHSSYSKKMLIVIMLVILYSVKRQLNLPYHSLACTFYRNVKEKPKSLLDLKLPWNNV